MFFISASHFHFLPRKSFRESHQSHEYCSILLGQRRQASPASYDYLIDGTSINDEISHGRPAQISDKKATRPVVQQKNQVFKADLAKIPPKLFMTDYDWGRPLDYESE